MFLHRNVFAMDPCILAFRGGSESCGRYNYNKLLGASLEKIGGVGSKPYRDPTARKPQAA